VDALVAEGATWWWTFRERRESQSRAEEDALGQSRAYLTDYSAEEVINWSYDSDGTLEMGDDTDELLAQVPEAAASWAEETRWIHYDRERYAVFSRAKETGPIDIVDEGRHGLSTYESAGLPNAGQ